MGPTQTACGKGITVLLCSVVGQVGMQRTVGALCPVPRIHFVEFAQKTLPRQIGHRNLVARHAWSIAGTATPAHLLAYLVLGLLRWKADFNATG